MLLPKIQVLDGDDADIVQCAVITQCADNWTVKPLSPKHFDPQAWIGPGVFTGGWWRISKKDSSAEPLDSTFDTAQLSWLPRAIVEAYIGRAQTEPGSLFHRVRQGLNELMAIGEENLDRAQDGSPVSGLLEQRTSIGLVERMDIIAAEIIIGSAGGPSHETRLNGAGFKMYTRSWVQGEQTQVRMRLGGDQRDMYPNFVAKANARLKELGLQNEEQ